MNTLLIYPKMTQTFWNMDFIYKMMGKKAGFPPLGLLTIASMLPNAWNKRLVDLNMDSLSPKDLRWAEIVFISAMSVQAESVKDIINECKKYKVKIVAGGTLFTHESLNYEDIDHLILNEAEITLPLFLNDLEKGIPKHIYSTNEFANIGLSPIPDWSLIDKSKYAYGIIQYSRGCHYNCDFCDVTNLLGKTPRLKNADQVLNELINLNESEDFDFILFADDNLIGNKNKLKKELLPALIKWRNTTKPKLSFATQVSVNLADDAELMQMMLEAGFRQIFVGIETPELNSLYQINKKQNLNRELSERINILQKNGFIIFGGFIVGFDEDTHSVFDKQIQLIQETGIVIPTINVLKAPPGSDLFENLKKSSRIVDSFSFHEVKTNIVPKMEIYTLYQGLSRLINTIYSPDSVYQRIMKFMSLYKPPKVTFGIKRRVKLSDFILVIRLLIYTGVISKFRKYFWKILYETATKTPKRIDLALLFITFISHFDIMLECYNETINSSKYKMVLEEIREKQNLIPTH